MLPTPKNYAIYPSVIPADREVELTVVPCEKAFLLVEGEEYDIGITHIGADEPFYHKSQTRHFLKATAHSGVLRFTYTFPGEMEHLIFLSRGETKLQEFNIYSLKEDLYRLRPLRGDFHSHSYRSDGKRDPAALAGHFREQGYDFFALTDHNRYFPGGEIDETYAGVKTGFSRVFGEEVHAPGSVVHIVHVGGKSSVADLYVHDREGYEAAIDEYMTHVPAHVPEEFRLRYACCMWVTDRIHEAGGLAIFAHPYWMPGGSRMVNVTTEYATMLLQSGMFDAYELVGGMGQEGVNRSVALWSDLRAEGLKISVVGSSDVHGLEKAYTFPYYSTVCFAEKNENDSIISAVKAGNSVAVEMTGDEYARHYRCYGSLRLVTYAQFLLRNYFPAMTRIEQGEGVAMRAYAIGEAEAQLIELQAQLADNFRMRFFGQMPPALPTPAMLAFEEKWREVQLNGPISKGSIVYTDKVSRQI
ncbi:MAG: hypothetical protein IJW99_09130 [Clostridia bacterium]|nr:hypothetical protein [Clostridia bacterium]